jgi:hypothetical protein
MGVDVREAALAAAAEEDAENQRAAAAEEAAKRELLDAARVRAMELVRASDLVRWFPGAEWEVYETAEEHYGWFGPCGMVAVVCSGRPEGTDPEWAGVPCFAVAPPSESAPVLRDRSRVRVFYVHSGQVDPGYTSWGGPQVYSLPELGRMIATHEEREREGRLEKAQEACRCFGRGCDPRAASLRCASAREHAAMLSAAASARCGMEYEQAVRPRRTATQIAGDEAHSPGADSLEVGEPIRSRPEAAKACPETGGVCQHPDDCRGPRGCWARHARIAGEPEGRTTGLHRDSMG